MTAFYDPQQAELFLFGELFGDATLGLDAGDRVYTPEVPQGAAYDWSAGPVLLFWPLMGQYAPSAGGSRQSATLTYVVEAMAPLDQTGAPAALDRLAGRILDLFDGRKETLSDGSYLSTVLISPWSRTDDLYGERLLRRGVIVQLYLRPVGASPLFQNAGGWPGMPLLPGTLKLSLAALGQNEAYTLSAAGEGSDVIKLDIPAGKVAQKVEVDFTYADLQLAVLGAKGGDLVVRTNAAVLAAPSAPSVNKADTTGTVLTGVYGVKVTLVNAYGESLASAASTVTTVADVSTITITHPTGAGTPPADVTGWYAYVTQPGGSIYTRQQIAGSPTAIGDNLVITAPPSSTGATVPTGSTCFSAVGDTLVLKNGTCKAFVANTSFANMFTMDVTDFAVTNGSAIGTGDGTTPSTLFFLELNTRTS